VYNRPVFQKLIKRAEEKRNFLQVLAGPRQVGKTTLALQVRESVSLPTHYASADYPTLRDMAWIEQQWEIGRIRTKQSNDPGGALLFLDEIQKIPGWADVVKHLWDQDTAQNVSLKVFLLGSSSLLMQTGLAESLLGRFEHIPISPWSYQECRDAFGWSLEHISFLEGIQVLLN